jgi:hypothetical protein
LRSITQRIASDPTISLDEQAAFCDSSRMPLRRLLPPLLIFAALLPVLGCTTTPQQTWESLKGEGFPGWSDTPGIRGAKAAKSSGYFTDRRSEQIEKDLGGF